MNARPTAAAAGKIDVGGDLTVNRLGFGAMRITGSGIWGDPPDRDRAIQALRRAVALDVNFIDTADSYGPEVSEHLIAEALYPYPEALVIATKGGLVRPGPGRWVPDGRPEHLRGACEGSLRRLRLDRIDLYQFHRPDPRVPIAESIGALAELKDEGKIRASWTREVMPSFQKMWRKWNATVCVLRNTRFATWRLLSPWATRPATRRSVSVRLSQPKAGRSAWAQCRSRVPAARRPDRTRARSSASPSSSYSA